MSDDFRLDIDPDIGNTLLSYIEGENGGSPVHIILIAFPASEDGTKIGTPTFLTSMSPEDMKRTMIHLGTDYMPKVVDPSRIRTTL